MTNKKDKPSLKGFEELAESLKMQDEAFAKTHLEQEEHRSHEQYEMQNFLELENTRLGKVETFIGKKIQAQTNFSQADKLIAIQEEHKLELLKKIVPSLGQLNSSLQKNLADIFNAHFS